MHNKTRAQKILCVALTGVAVCTLPGCGEDEDDDIIEVEYVQETTEAGTLYTAELGEAITYADVTITVESACMPDYVLEDSDEDVKMVFYTVSATNNTEEEISLGIVSGTFYGLADGEAYSTSTLRSAIFLTRQYGDDVEYFNDALAAGETREGYVYLEYPEDCTEVSIIIYPGACVGDMSEAYEVTFACEDLEEAPDPVTPLDGDDDDDDVDDDDDDDDEEE